MNYTRMRNFKQTSYYSKNKLLNKMKQEFRDTSRQRGKKPAYKKDQPRLESARANKRQRDRIAPNKAKKRKRREGLLDYGRFGAKKYGLTKRRSESVLRKGKSELQRKGSVLSEQESKGKRIWKLGEKFGALRKLSRNEELLRRERMKCYYNMKGSGSRERGKVRRERDKENEPGRANKKLFKIVDKGKRVESSLEKFQYLPKREKKNVLRLSRELVGRSLDGLRSKYERRIDYSLKKNSLRGLKKCSSNVDVRRIVENSFKIKKVNQEYYLGNQMNLNYRKARVSKKQSFKEQNSLLPDHKKHTSSYKSLKKTYSTEALTKHKAKLKHSGSCLTSRRLLKQHKKKQSYYALKTTRVFTNLNPRRSAEDLSIKQKKATNLHRAFQLRRSSTIQPSSCRTYVNFELKRFRKNWLRENFKMVLKGKLRIMSFWAGPWEKEPTLLSDRPRIRRMAQWLRLRRIIS
jgi:hypothetical protein